MSYLWGDSNAAHYIGLLGSIAKEQKWSFRNISHAACPPIFSDVKPFVKLERYDDCQSSIHLVKLKLSQYRTIIISAAYDSYVRKSLDFMKYFEETVETLVKNEHQVIIIGKAPVFNDFDRHCLEKSFAFPLKNCFKVEQRHKLEIDTINSRLLTFAQTRKNVKYIDFNSTLCGGSCSPYKNSKPMYFDSGHIEIQSSWQLGKQLIKNDKIPKLFNNTILSR
jgi:hypothetical protein